MLRQKNGKELQARLDDYIPMLFLTVVLTEALKIYGFLQ